MILSFRTDRPGQTVQTQIRLLLVRVYTVCHSVCIVWTHYSMVEPHSSNLKVIKTNFWGVRIFRKFMVSIKARNRRHVHVRVMDVYKFHAYQSLACETAINTDFSELFSLKRIYVKYKNAILSLIDSLLRIWKDKIYGQVFSQIFNYYGETRSQERTNQISGKVQAHLSYSSMCRKSNLYVAK